jgi:translation initiation factor 6
VKKLASKAQTGNVQLMDIFGTPHLGLFATACESYAIIPPGLPQRKTELVSNTLGVEPIITYIAGSSLIGAFACLNSNGVILPKIVLEEEVEEIRKSAPSLNIYVYEGRETALGNLLAANDHVVLVSPEIQPNERRRIADTLGVEAITTTIAGRLHVGSITLLTNSGGLIHVDASDGEIELIEHRTGLKIYRATVNNGNYFIRSGILANTKGALIGSRTIGPELMVISTALKL